MTHPSLPRRLLTQLSAQPLLRPLAALALLLLVALFLVPGFFALEIKDGRFYGSLVDIAQRAAPLMLAALGMSLVIAMRGIDISVGAVVALAGTVACWLLLKGHGTLLALAAGLAIALVCGAWNALLVAVLGLQPIVATLILMVAGRGLAQLISDGQILTVYEPASFFLLGAGYWLGLPVALFVVAGLYGLVAIALRRTALGLFISAVGLNPVAARLAGLRSSLLIALSYVACAACAGLAGLMIASNIKSADANNAGQLLELDAILAVTLGGGQLSGGSLNLAGTLVGALIIQTLNALIYTLGVPPQLTLVVKALVVFAVCIAQSPVWASRKGAAA